MNFNEQKATAVASYFLQRAGGELDDLKLMKLMYLAERETIRRYNCGITGDAFFSMQNGPVLSETLRLVQGRPRRTKGEVWNEHIETPEQWRIRLKRPLEADVLSEAEQQELEQEWGRHGRKNKWKLVDITHTFPEWDERARELKTSIPIPMVDILEALDLPRKTIEARLNEMRAADYFEDLIDQAEAGLLEASR
jgi:uncharacterized phage-associated protein